MDSTALLFLLVNGVALLVLPRRWASLPLIVGACYMTRGEGIDLGPFRFTIIRILVAIAVGRTIVKHEWPSGGLNLLDSLMITWGLWMIASVWFHVNPLFQVINRLGLVFDGWGLYFVFRGLCRSRAEIVHICRVVAIVLGPIAVAMFVEQLTAHNLFAVFGGVPPIPQIRDGSIRAQGPFAHAILAGNIGAVCLPMMIGLWPHYRRTSIIGIAACATMVYACVSSGPIITAAIGTAAIMIWPWGHYTKLMRQAAVIVYLVLAVVMNSPPYYLMARLDLTSGSTGWHRARLIESAFEHFGEWWLMGTDYTRHWMPTGVSWSADHTDITNHYLNMGVMGGLPLMLLFIAVLATGLSYIGEGLRRNEHSSTAPFTVWALGAALSAHVATCLAVSYFDQSIVFLYLTLAAAGAARLVPIMQNRPLVVSGSTRVPVRARKAARRRTIRHSLSRRVNPNRVMSETIANWR